MKTGIAWLIAASLAGMSVAGATALAQAPVPEEEAQSFSGNWEGEMAPPRWPAYLHISLDLSADPVGSIYTLGQTIELGDPRYDGETLTVSLIGPWSITPRIHLRQTGEGLVGDWQEEDSHYPMWLGRVPDLPTPDDRTAAWLQDIDTLDTRFLRFDRSFGVEARTEFRQRLAELRDRVADMSDGEIMIALSQAVALADNAHTRLYMLRNRTVFRRLPIRFWWFGDSLRIVSANANHRHLLGCQIDTISGTPALEAQEIAATAVSGNLSWANYKSTYLLSSPETLHGLGLAAPDAPVELGLSDCEAGSIATVSALPLERSDDPVEAWWELSPYLAVQNGRVQVLADRTDNLPLYLSQSDNVHWYQRLDGQGLFYIQLNRAEAMGDQDFGDFSESLLAAFRAQPNRALVIDLRFNTGGNASLLEDLMETLQAESADMRRYIITGRATFSAGILVAAEWREGGNVTLVGEPVGDVLDYWAEGGNIILPNSRVNAHFANGAHRYSGAPCPDENYCLQIDIDTLAPDIPQSASWEDYLNGRDPALESIIADLANVPAGD